MTHTLYVAILGSNALENIMTNYNTETRRIKLIKSHSNENVQVLPFPFDIQSCKRAFTTRNIKTENMQTLISGSIRPKAGDLVLCEVTRLRQHCRIEQPNGRRSRMFVKDKIIVCYGDRYAPDQFESVVPENLGACHLVAGGGIASLMRHKSPKVKPATEIQPIGLIGDSDGQILNLKDHQTLNVYNSDDQNFVPVLMVAGSSMNAGKTTTVASLIKGLTADGYEVGAVKITGTGSGGDLWHFIDAGAKHVIDFTDAGHASTYLVKHEKLLRDYHKMINHLKSKNVDVIVVEIADGILQHETKKLLQSTDLINTTTAMYYTSGDSSSAIYGSHWLEKTGYDVMALSGVVSSNPLGVQEINQATNIPVITKKQMCEAGSGHLLFETLTNKASQLKVK